MKNPVLDKKHFKEYFIYGSIAAIVYAVPVLIFFYRNKFENLYLLYVGSALFMAAIFSYSYKLLYRPYEKKRAAAMLMAGHLATIIGVLLAIVIVIISFFIYFPQAFSAMPQDDVLKNAHSSTETNSPVKLLFMVLIVTVVANTGVGSFISVITAYAGKLNQTKDRPASLENNLQVTANK